MKSLAIVVFCLAVASELAPTQAAQSSGSSEAYLAKILASSNEPVPDELDWRKVPGRVSSVKDQGECNCAYAFSALGALEGQATVRNVSLVDLSVQQMIDCTRANSGCSGGTSDEAFLDIRDYEGIMTAEDYPFTGVTGKCRIDYEKKIMPIDGFIELFPPGDETLLKQVLAKFGPISIRLIETSSLHAYKSGVFHIKNCFFDETALYHYALLVGYGTDPKVGLDYWLVKNSWGTEWGEQGYFRIKRGVNMCAIAYHSLIPKF